MKRPSLGLPAVGSPKILDREAVKKVGNSRKRVEKRLGR